MQQENYHPKLGKWGFYLLTAALFLAAAGFILMWHLNSEAEFNRSIFISGLIVGVVAQMVDGALGMAYGITATTFLLSQGIPPAIATGSVHIAEIFTTGASGLSHWKMGNVNKKLLHALIIPGIIGGVVGALLITNIDGKTIRPWVAAYLLVMGLYILLKAFKKISLQTLINRKKVSSLALAGGFVDAVGGGGWGPVVTTTLLGSGHEPKGTIGSVNAAEFFVTSATGFSFAVLIGVSHWEVVAGLIVGGLIAAPLSAKILSKIPVKFLMILVGLLIVSLSIFNIYKSLI